MAFVEHLDGFFADFGVACAKDAITFTALLDMPEDTVGLGEVGAIASNPSILYRTDAVSLVYGDTVTVAGTAYRVNEVASVDDGQLTRARIGRI